MNGCKSRTCVVFVTAPTGKTTRHIAESLLKKRLCACVNIVSSISSFYWWKGKMEKSKESLLIFKTKTSLIPSFIRHIRRVHPYDVPEVLALSVERGMPSYLKWIENETKA